VHPAWEDEDDWSPRALPAPSYTLKPTVRVQYARPLSDEDLAGSSYGHGEVAAEAAPASGQLDAILQRRRRATA
jgi:hypothetical protein